jgi:hypothetical protein
MAETTTFTSWSDLYARMLDDLASGSFRKMQGYSISAGGAGGQRSVQYRTYAEFKQMLEFVKEKADEETGQGYRGRTYAANGGRGQ